MASSAGLADACRSPETKGFRKRAAVWTIGVPAHTRTWVGTIVVIVMERGLSLFRPTCQRRVMSCTGVGGTVGGTVRGVEEAGRPTGGRGRRRKPAKRERVRWMRGTGTSTRITTQQNTRGHHARHAMAARLARGLRFSCANLSPGHRRWKHRGQGAKQVGCFLPWYRPCTYKWGYSCCALNVPRSALFVIHIHALHASSSFSPFTLIRFIHTRPLACRRQRGRRRTATDHRSGAARV
mmetsp:Transcript_16648/g.51636  ORF Transcript_16648/g.51636 Transcript_16648/m.51636 type:complete len:238 (+) Transcript_16648:108-821(+)